MKKRFFAALLAGILLASTPAFAVYKDEIAVSQDEVWKAVIEVMKPFGIRKQKADKKEITSKWIYDTVTRSGGVFKSIAREEYDRRYRFKIKLNDRVGDTTVEIRGVFQQRRTGLNEAAAWRLFRVKADDLDVEREFFMKILKQIGNTRRAAGA